MTFTTFTFLAFLTLVFALYWRTKSQKRQNVLLLVASCVFYSWWDYRFCALMLASASGDYIFARLLGRTERTPVRRLLLTASCVFNLGILGFFKYYNFFAESLVDVFNALGWRLDVATVYVILPVGISFYTFQSMSYVIDVYRRQLEPSRNWLDYLTYVSFFPQLVAGPIERGTQLLPQILSHRKFDFDIAVDGLRLILWGFFKKMVIADNLAILVDQAYSNPAQYDGARLAMATVCFAFQIYGDFSAYSDIAIGTAALFGVRLMRNFAYPYFSQNVAEFWRRWHISLSTWFRDYLYLPLGGNRVPAGRRVFNILTTFVISGLWHGAAWNFLIWGFLNGVGMLPAVCRAGPRTTPKDVPGGVGWLPSAKALFSMAATFTFICLTWVFFRARTFQDAVLVLERVVTWPFVTQASEGFVQNLSTKGIFILIFVFVLVEWIWRARLHPLHFGRLPRVARWTVYTALIWVTFYLRPPLTGSFIYFQF